MSQSLCIFTPQSGIMAGIGDGPAAIWSFLLHLWSADDCRNTIGYDIGLFISVIATVGVTVFAQRLARRMLQGLTHFVLYDSSTREMNRRRLDRLAAGYSGKPSDPAMIWTRRPLVLAVERRVASVFAFLLHRRREAA